jgi:prevent-host-death family protein
LRFQRLLPSPDLIRGWEKVADKPDEGSSFCYVEETEGPLAFLNVIADIEAMRTISDRELRKNLASALDRVTEDREPVIITRDRGKPAAVLMSMEEFASYEETVHLQRNTTI